MSLCKWFFIQVRIVVSIAVIIFSALLTSAKTPTNTKPTSAGEPVFNLSDFNPVGDGVADDGPALQRALDALANAGGGTLLIPAGRYRIKTPVEKDFSSVGGARVNIQGVPSTKMPAPVTGTGEQLSMGLDLTSEIIPATGDKKTAITLSHLRELTIEHMGFTGDESAMTDAFITLYLIDIDKATVRHCEFYGISTFGVITELGGGNIIRALRSELSIELSVFLGCTANSGAYAPIVENWEWRRISVSNSIFLDYGQRAFYSKMGMGAPLSWIGIEHAALPTPESPRREVIIRDTFLDEGGWVGISVLAHRHFGPPPPMHLLYISGLKMNVSNMVTTGHLIYDIRDLLIENSHYGWSINSYAALDINRVDNAILDNLTCIDHADRIRTDDRTGRLTLINSVYKTLDSLAGTTTVLETTPEQDPVQYVRRQFLTVAGRQPDPAAHFYWSDLLIKCGTDNACLNQHQSALNEYLKKRPSETFAISGKVIDENGNPLAGVAVSLSETPPLTIVTDSQGTFRFSGLPTSGSYTVAVNKNHFSFTASSQTFVNPATDVTAVFNGRLNRHAISGRIVKASGAAVSGVTVQLAQAPEITATTDENGFYSFTELAAGNTYTVVPSLDDFSFDPVSTTFEDLSEDRVTNFAGTLMIFSFTGSVSDEEGNPLSEVTVNLTGSKSASTLTDSRGAFQFSDLPTSGNYTVSVEKEQYAFDTNSLTVKAPEDHVDVVFVGKLRPELMTIESSGFALALDSVGFTLQPFSIFNSLGLNNDGYIRVMLLAKDFEPSITKSQVSVVAKDDEGRAYPVEIEFMGEIPGQSWLQQLNVKLAATSVSGKCLQLTLATADVNSNAGRICFAK